MPKRAAGRPPKYDRGFYLDIQRVHKDMSISQMAEHYGVSARTVTRWITKAKQMMKGDSSDGTKQ